MTATNPRIGPHSPGVMEQAVDDDLIIFDPRTESYYTLNRTAREVWELADGSRTADDIAAKLAEHYAVKVEQLKPDVAEIIANLAAARLI